MPGVEGGEAGRALKRETPGTEVPGVLVTKCWRRSRVWLIPPNQPSPYPSSFQYPAARCHRGIGSGKGPSFFP